MGCVSSKLLKKNLKQELLFGSGDLPNHVVSLKSSTLGVLNQNQNQNQKKIQVVFPSSSPFKTINSNEEEKLEHKKEVKGGVLSGSKRLQSEEELEVINTWELMEDLEEGVPASPNSIQERSPLKRLVSQVGSPKGGKKLGGKENRGIDNTKKQQCYTTPRSGALKSWKLSSNSTNKLRKASCMDSPRRSNANANGNVNVNAWRRSLGPLIDSVEKEEIKEMVYSSSSSNSNSKNRYCSPDSSMEKCPPGGENCVVMYTTTLRGIRKTFEDCNIARKVMESYNVRVIERDVSMDSGYKEELRKLMVDVQTRPPTPPVVFIKGRLIGGAEEVVKLDEQGKLQGLLEGISISKGLSGCEGCGGIRFLMCMDCNGSCKVLDLNNNKIMLRCGECNENGLIHCPICC
ncbi:hypothetical protein SOVF_119060 [Spinacia oleracea]|uniref:Uncharacterized protein At3g28850 n=1 Tax=Spinacia oleracea TaxID=3562 RepID=A0A9R0KAW8_SPIOL|nr:uncharacterized protein At3g28850 [Spinacia oleracea]KNA13186.1 hypothetical protein SOVF_119060 [Spinacia oleracea]